MPRGAKPPRNNGPRRIGTPTDRQERFALCYVKTLDKSEALRLAGYKLNSPEAERDAANRLLRNPTVLAIIDREKALIAKKYMIDAEGTVLRFMIVYQEAMRASDFNAAVSCLKELGKHYGIYEKHQKQKYTQEDAARLRLELEQVGFDFTRAALVSNN